MEILGIITARGSSKGIADKNMVKLSGKPLIQYTFEAARKSKKLNRIILTTDDTKIVKFGKRFVEVPFMRPKRLAKDDTPTFPVLIHALQFLKRKDDYEPDIVVLLQPTSPFRKTYHIDEAIGLLIKTDADSVVSVCEVSPSENIYYSERIINGRLIPFFKSRKRPASRHELPKLYARNGAIYCMKRDTLVRKKSLFGKHCRPYIMPKKYSVNINGPLDLALAEVLMRRER